MRRVFSIMMASVLMALSLSAGLTAMAETYTSLTGTTEDVYYTYTKEDTEVLTPVYSVDIEMGDLTFNYTYKEKQVWDFDNHKIKTVKDATASKWDKTDVNVTVTNNSNVGVYVKGKVTNKNVNGIGLVDSTGHGISQWLNPPKTEGGTGESVTYRVVVTGEPLSETSERSAIGTVSITLSASAS